MNWWPLFLHWIVSSLALTITAFLVPGFRIKGITTAMMATLLIGAANFFIKPFLLFLTLPLTVLTLGFFLFVVDAAILRLCAAFLKNFEITNWFSAVIGTVILSLTSGYLHYLFI
jgi:putative membrane protein